MNISAQSRKLAEEICKKKFNEFVEEESKKNNATHKIDVFKLQIPMWKKLGNTQLSLYEIEKEPPIKQALYVLCNDKIKWCMNKLLTYESDEE
jgi:hypothetical protein